MYPRCISFAIAAYVTFFLLRIDGHTFVSYFSLSNVSDRKVEIYWPFFQDVKKKFRADYMHQKNVNYGLLKYA